VQRFACAAGIAVLAAQGLAGCREQAPVARSAPVSPAPPAEVMRAGVKVPLPPGWTAQLAADDSFQAGPEGRPALRVDIRPGDAAQLPTLEALKAALPARLRDFTVGFTREEAGPGLTLVAVTLTPATRDGGGESGRPALFGAKSVGKDLFLCASLPGATRPEVQLAFAACREIDVQESRR